MKKSINSTNLEEKYFLRGFETKVQVTKQNHDPQQNFGRRDLLKYLSHSSMYQSRKYPGLLSVFEVKTGVDFESAKHKNKTNMDT